MEGQKISTKEQGHSSGVWKKLKSVNLFFEKVSLAISGSLESFFFNWGFQIASHPWKFILGCLIFALTCGVGLLGFTPENRPINLWIPGDSDFIKNTDWLIENFPSPIRFHYAIITADNVLDTKIIRTLLDIHEKVDKIEANNKTWPELCFKLPVTPHSPPATRRRRRRRNVVQESANENQITFGEVEFPGFEEFFSGPEFEDGYVGPEFDPSVDLPTDMYCDILKSLEYACWESNLLELWNYNSSIISSLTNEDVLAAINNHRISPVYGRPFNYTNELSGIERNETGHIVKAKAVLLRWYSRINQTAIQNGFAEMDKGTGEIVDNDNLLWETKFGNLLLNYELPEDASLYLKLARSFGDISDSTIWGDAHMLAVGFSIVFIYVFLMLGQWNWIHSRPLLTLAGMSCIGLAMLVSYGLCSSVKLIFGPVHNILPFLLLGIGIDDMFVIMQCWNNLSPSVAKLPLAERVGLTLKHAGVSITVTSITDFAAFAVGGTTVLPALKSFCIYAALGVIATYIFQATFFTAWLVLDMRRVEENRNAFCCWKIHRDYVPSNCSKQNFAQRIFGGVYSNLLLTRTGKAMVMLFTFSFFGVNLWGNTNLRQEFDPAWFLPHDSHLAKYVEARNKHFAGMGHEAFVLVHNISLWENLRQFDDLASRLEASKSIYEVEFWYINFKQYMNTHYSADVPNKEMSEKKFNKYISKFLFSPSGSKYREKFKFRGNITCGLSAPTIETTVLTFKFRSFRGPQEHIPAMRELKAIVKEASENYTSDHRNNSFLWSFGFAAWETDEIITVELYRNMGLALGCVLITTLLLIANLLTCLMVLLCVILTLVDVLGGMYFWGLTIDTVSCIDLVLAIGLCVDYAAHIGHAFMTNSGTRDQRAKQALRDIGPAVLNGGFSTFLALLLVADAKSHVFISFFKIFSMVVVFGLFHGLVFLPVLLSLCGSRPYSRSSHTVNSSSGNGNTAHYNHDDTEDPNHQTVALVPKTNPNGILYKNGNENIHVYQPVDVREQSVGI